MMNGEFKSTGLLSPTSENEPVFCPYCGGAMYLRTSFENQQKFPDLFAWFECIHCDSSAPLSYGSTEEEAIEGACIAATHRAKAKW